MMKSRRGGQRRSGVKVALVALVFASQAFAQEARQSVAQLRDVSGNTLVSKESGLAAGTEGLRLVPGTRVITTNKSGAIIAYDDGCKVTLKENERFEVQTGKPCAELMAMPASILSTPAGAAAAAGGGAALAFGAAVPLIGGAAAGLAVLRSIRESQPVSPS
jgi:hypothetical protein